MAVANRRVLVIGPQGGLASAAAPELDSGDLPTRFVADETFDWTDEDAVKALFDESCPSLLLHEIDLRHPSLLKPRAGSRHRALIERSQLLAATCAERDCVAMHLSDYHVFGGDTKNAYDEAESIAPLDNYGSFIAELEQQFTQSLERHLILRFSWLIDPEGENLFTRILRSLSEGGELTLSRYRRGAPTWNADARRVIKGVVRQVISGAENWGYFHYCSSDSCNEWEFGSEVAATFEETHSVRGKVLPDDLKDRDEYPLEPASATLNCRRIRDNFGVHGRSWRQGLKAQISQWEAVAEGR